MDIFSGKKPLAGSAIQRKRSSFVSKDTAARSHDVEFCNRIGCNGRLKYSKNCLFGFTGKPKYPRPSSCSLTSEVINGCSSATSKTKHGGISKPVSKREGSSHLGTDLSQSSNVQYHLDDNGSSPSSTTDQAGLRPKGSTHGNATLTEVGRSNLASQSRSVSVFGHKPASGYPSAVSASSASTASSTTLPISGLTRRKNNKGNRYGLRNPHCDSVSDIIPSAGLKSEAKICRKPFINDRSPERESSSSSGERRSNRAVKSEERPVSRSSGGVTISSSRHTRNLSSVTDGSSTSARSRRSTVSQTRMKSSNRDNFREFSLAESTSITSQSPQHDTITEARVSGPSVDSSTEGFSRVSGHNVSGHNAENMPSALTSLEQDVSHDLWRHSLNGIAEILASLERIGEEAELTYEQLASFESNLFLGSFHWYDQHRDMRLDIDNMSYEELLALEEQMGTVSTALPEEALSKCIRRSIFQIPSAQMGFSNCSENEDDVRCSVCQEEISLGEEIGKLLCDHRYHAGCIEQWLRLKNWCPICKASAAPLT